MTETEIFNKILLYLYDNRDNKVHIGDLTTYIGGDIAGTRLERALDHLCTINFANRDYKGAVASSGAGRSLYDYYADSIGILFIDSVPAEFKDKPYTYYLKLAADEKAIKADRAETDHKLKQVTLANIGLYKGLALGSLFVALAAIVVPIIINKMDGDKPIKTESTIPQIDKIQETLQQEQRMLKDILDSLRKK